MFLIITSDPSTFKIDHPKIIVKGVKKVLSAVHNRISNYLKGNNMSRDMRVQTMWFVRPAKPQISLHIRAV